MEITVTQVNPVTETLPHLVTNDVIKPVIQGRVLEEMPLTTMIHNLLFKVMKDTDVFWVGAAVPFGTMDFTKIQVFFHPTVVQGPKVHAREADYPTFTGGWPNILQRYVALVGGQIAGARQVAMLVPFTTMAALGGGAANMFTTDPVATLSFITAAIQKTLDPLNFLSPPTVNAVGVASFSSGIGAMKMFINAMAPSGLIKEVIDFDSPFIIGNPPALTMSAGAVSSCYSQVPHPSSPAGYKFMPQASFDHLTSFDHNPHSCIGWMMYYTAMLNSVII